MKVEPTFGDLMAAHKSDVSRISESGYYKSQRTAERFFAQRIDLAWRQSMGLDVDDGDDLVARFRITPTSIRILHLFARSMHRVGYVKGKTPIVHNWPPIAGSPIRIVTCLSKRSIGTIVGASEKAVEEALRRIKSSEDDGLVSRRLANVISVESGVLLDGIFESQMSFSFRYEIGVYQEANMYALDQRQRGSAFALRQQQWSREAIASKGGTPKSTAIGEDLFARVHAAAEE